MQLQLVGQRGRFPRAHLVDPPSSGYIQLAASVRPPIGTTPFTRSEDRRTRLLGQLKPLARELAQRDDVRKASVFRSIVIPPPAGYAQREGVHHARFDVVVLVETTSPETIGAVQASEPYRRLHDVLAEAAQDLHVMAARCARSMGDVDRDRQGLFLFNFYIADDPAASLELWEWLAGWYATQTGMNNSLVLEPVDKSDYAFVGHARWDYGLPLFMVRQFTKPSFRSYVLANLMVNRTGSMPALYHLA